MSLHEVSKLDDAFFFFLFLFHYIFLFYLRSFIILFLSRFGSFEIFKTVDPLTGYQGPSAGRLDILHRLLNYTINNFFPQVNYCFCFNKCFVFNTKTTTMGWSIIVVVLIFRPHLLNSKSIYDLIESKCYCNLLHD